MKAPRKLGLARVHAALPVEAARTPVKVWSSVAPRHTRTVAVVLPVIANGTAHTSHAPVGGAAAHQAFSGPVPVVLSASSTPPHARVRP